MILPLLLNITLVAAPVLTNEQQAGNVDLFIPSSKVIKVKNYNHPGVIANQGSQEPDGKGSDWIGGDHLINLPSNIPVQMDLSLPEGVALDINEIKLEMLVEDVFKKHDIKTDSHLDTTTGPLPFFNLVVTVYRVPKGFVYMVEGRLFEAVRLERVAFDEGVTIQAITWEMTSLNGVPERDLSLELTKSVLGVASTFAERYTYFKKIERSQKG